MRALPLAALLALAPACLPPEPGSVERGGGCLASADCGDGYCTGEYGQLPSSCAPLRAEGQSCASDSRSYDGPTGNRVIDFVMLPCAPGLSCAAVPEGFICRPTTVAPSLRATAAADLL